MLEDRLALALGERRQKGWPITRASASFASWLPGDGIASTSTTPTRRWCASSPLGERGDRGRGDRDRCLDARPHQEPAWQVGTSHRAGPAEHEHLYCTDKGTTASRIRAVPRGIAVKWGGVAQPDNQRGVSSPVLPLLAEVHSATGSRATGRGRSILARELTSEHFAVWTNAAPDRARTLVRTMENLRQVVLGVAAFR